MFLIPILWARFEKLQPGPDYRVPYRLSHDYWFVRRYFGRVAAEDKTLVLGDSVVWGHYVGKEETLSHYLNELTGSDRFANLGIDGIHPAAMAGLVEHYGTDIAGKRVLVHLNLLWMSSRRHDLTSGKESTLNHPKLVWQFYPAVPDYRASLSERIGIVVGRNVPFFGWVDHLRIAYFEDRDLPRWTLEHPYANPASAVTLELPSPDEPPSPEPVAKPWTAKGIRPFNPPWVELEHSLQWRSFRRTIEVLRSRGNNVFVLVGPFNEHMLGAERAPRALRPIARGRGRRPSGFSSRASPTAPPRPCRPNTTPTPAIRSPKGTALSPSSSWKTRRSCGSSGPARIGSERLWRFAA